MAQLIMALLFPILVFIALVVSWQTKKKKAEKQKPAAVRVTFFHSPRAQDSIPKKQPPMLIRMPKMID
jgi:hypothetical protein